MDETLTILLVVQEDKTIKFRIASRKKIDLLFYSYFQPIFCIMAQAYDVWSRHIEKIRVYIRSSSCADEGLLENYKLSHQLATEHDMFLLDYETSNRYKDDCLKWLQEAKTQLITLDQLLSKRSNLSSGPLSRKDSDFHLLPKWSDLKKTIGSLGLLENRLKSFLLPDLYKIDLNRWEDKPHRETLLRIRTLLGPTDEMKGTRIATTDPSDLISKLKTLH